MRHDKKKHKDVLHVKGMSLLDMIFNVTRAVDSAEVDGDITSEACGYIHQSLQIQTT